MKKKKVNISVDELLQTETTPNNGGEIQSGETDNALFGNVASVEQPAAVEPVAAETVAEQKELLSDVDNILNNLNDYQSAVPENELPEIKKRRRRTKLEMQQGGGVAQPAGEQGFVIPGSLFVTVNDMVFSSAFGFIDSLASKRPIDPAILRLSEQQIKDLTPIADAAIKQMKLSSDPVTVFYGSLAAIYLTNYLTIKQIQKIQNAK